MKNYIFLPIIALLIVGCASSKELKNQNQTLNNQVNQLQTNVDRLAKDNETLNSKFIGLEVSSAKINTKLLECNSEVEKCNSELENISSIYNSYSSKIKKMKSELEAAFPNNLKDANFAIVEEDGRLIVIFPNNILYQSGNADFSTDALFVIQKLSKVFMANKELNILVEGHTDNVPLRKGSKYEDNWDLSLARAVNIVRQMETYGVHPQRLTAAGRANFAPIDKMDSDEARAKNRRTEIIIRPKIDEVMKAMSELN